MPRNLPLVRDGVLHLPGAAGAPTVPVGSPAWSHWLDDPATHAFVFQDRAETYTARRDPRRRGADSWTAYRTSGGRTISTHLGHSTELTTERLVLVAERLAARVRRTVASPPVARGPVPSSAPAPVLATKLSRPRLRGSLVPRPRLLRQLDAGQVCALTLIAAPAGCGKTTLLGLWLQQTTLPSAWLALDEGDNDPGTFFRALIAAVQTVAPTVGTTASALLQTPEPPRPDVLMTLLLNDLITVEQPLIVVLDDYHVITAPAIHQAIGLLVARCPPALRLLIASREDPPLPLARLRVQRELLELRAADLRFDPAEVATFLTEVMELPLSPDDVAALETRTEGWIAGLQLAALVLRDHPDRAGVLDAFSESHHFVFDYLGEEVIDRLAAPLHDFVLRTAILDRLCGPLCDAVLAVSDALRPAVDGSSRSPPSLSDSPSQLHLDELERRNLFLVPLDERREWYRYHHLFHDVLRRRLARSTTAEARAALHRGAAAWYAQHGLITDAVQHTLAAQDWPQAAPLIEQYGVTMAGNGQIQLVLGWLHGLPPSIRRSRPTLQLIYAFSLLLEGQLGAAEACLREVEHALGADISDDQTDRIRGSLAMYQAILRRYRGDLSGYIRLTGEAVACLPTTMALSSLASVAHEHAFWLHGDASPTVEQAVIAAADRARADGNLVAAPFGVTLLADLYAARGHLRQAETAYLRVADLVGELEVLEHLFGGPAYYFGLGDLRREWNDLAGAEQLVAHGFRVASDSRRVYPDLLLRGAVAQARLQQARGDGAAALGTLAAFVQLAEHRQLEPALIARAHATRARITLEQGNLAAAIAWADSSGCSTTHAGSFLDEPTYLTYCRVRLAQGRHLAAGHALHEAAQLLNQLAQAAEAGGRGGSLLEIGMLRALVLAAHDQVAAALIVLAPVLNQAAPEGYTRLFLDEGAPMQALLRTAYEHGIARAYIETRLATDLSDDTRSDAPTATAQPLLEPLTSRELEVLDLLAAGRSTQTIAAELIVADGTVKRHIRNILGKLQVHSRLEAVARARDIGIIR